MLTPTRSCTVPRCARRVQHNPIVDCLRLKGSLYPFTCIVGTDGITYQPFDRLALAKHNQQLPQTKSSSVSPPTINDNIDNSYSTIDPPILSSTSNDDVTPSDDILDDPMSIIKDYNDFVNYLNDKMDNNKDPADQVWRFSHIVKHEGPLTKTLPSWKGSKYNVLVAWEGNYEPLWEPMDSIMKDDPVTLAIYARNVTSCCQHQDGNNSSLSIETKHG